MATHQPTPKAAPQGRKLAGKRASGTPQTFDGKTGFPITPTRKRYRAKLDSLRDVRRELAKVYRLMMGGTLDPVLAGRAGFLLGMIGRVIEGGELEKRLDALEAKSDALQEQSRHA